jgi:putative membrane protein
MKKRFMTGAVAITASMLLGIGSVGAADNAKGNHPDRKFFNEAAQGGMAEVALGQMAADKAESDAVKNFGQRMVTDHGKANQELKDLAASEGVTLPNEMSSEAKALQKKLSGLSGAEFDKAYMKEMLKDHKKDISAFKKEAEQGQDSDVKNWAAKTLPTLQEHYTVAQTTSSQIGVKSTDKSGSPSAMGGDDQSSMDETGATGNESHVGTADSSSHTK